MTIQFQRAQRTAVKLKALLTGPSGSGKTTGALSLARDLGFQKIAVIDSENDRASYYADQFTFDVVSVADAKPSAYQAAMLAAVNAGYDVVIIDSLSHAWQNVLDRKDAYDKANPKSNQWANWRTFGAEWESFIRDILLLPSHVIATARSKQEYEQTTDKKIVKLGLAPQIREGTDYEFALHCDINDQHKIDVRKDNTGLFGDKTAVWDLTNGSIAKPLASWLGSAKPVATPSADTLKAMDAAIAEMPEEKQAATRTRWAQMRQKGVDDVAGQEMLAKVKAMAVPATQKGDGAPSTSIHGNDAP